MQIYKAYRAAKALKKIRNVIGDIDCKWECCRDLSQYPPQYPAPYGQQQRGKKNQRGKIAQKCGQLNVSSSKLCERCSHDRCDTCRRRIELPDPRDMFKK